MLFAKTKHEPKNITFAEFSESSRSKFAETQSGLRDHKGNRLLEKAESKKQLKKFRRQLKLHKDALDR